jgi:hypothetical protein
MMYWTVLIDFINPLVIMGFDINLIFVGFIGCDRRTSICWLYTYLFTGLDIAGVHGCSSFAENPSSNLEIN